jgi:hypothetical protein
MIHILAGAAIGALMAAVGLIAFDLVLRRRFGWRQVVAAGVGGAVAGLITTATFGAGGLAAASMARAATGLIASGAAGGAATRLTQNELEHKPLAQGVAGSAVIGAAGNVVSGGIMKYGIGPIVLRTFPRLAPVLGLGAAPRRAPTAAAAAPAAVVVRATTAPAAAPSVHAPVSTTTAAPAASSAVAPPPGPPQAGICDALGGP